MHAIFDVRFEISIDDEKTVPMAGLSEFITEQDIQVSILFQSRLRVVRR